MAYGVPAENPPEKTRRPAKRRRDSLWFQLHFWVGWIAAIPLLIVCVTGIALSFEKEFYRWEQPEHYALTPEADRLSLSEVVAIYEEARPRIHLIYLEVPESPERAYLAFASELDENGKRIRGLRAYVNPYTGELTREGKVPTLIRQLEFWHRHMTLEKPGRWIIAVSSVLLAVTSIAGLVLWWPMRRGTIKRMRNRRRLLDWHNVIGLVALIPLIVFAITGITYTWGKHVFPFLEEVQGRPSRLVIPEIPVDETIAGSETVPLAEVVRTVQRDFPEFDIRGVQGSTNLSRPYVFSLRADYDIHPGGTLKLFYNPRTGEEFGRHDMRSNGPVGWYRRYFGILHTGDMFSWVGRIPWALGSLAGVVLIITGMWLSIRRWRRRKGTVSSGD